MKSSSNLFKDKLGDAYSKQPNVKYNKETLDDYMKFTNAMEQEETKEATGASSAGGYSSPIFTKEEQENFINWLIILNDAPFSIKAMSMIQEVHSDLKKSDFWENDMKAKLFDAYPGLMGGRD